MKPSAVEKNAYHHIDAGSVTRSCRLCPSRALPLSWNTAAERVAAVTSMTGGNVPGTTVPLRSDIWLVSVLSAIVDDCSCTVVLARPKPLAVGTTVPITRTACAASCELTATDGSTNELIARTEARARCIG